MSCLLEPTACEVAYWFTFAEELAVLFEKRESSKFR
jgi:hypothetical protein